MIETAEIQKKKKSVALLSVVSNTILTAFKLLVGILVGSVSIISEAIHSGVDLIASMIALFSVQTSSKPADSEHQFGHGKIENFSGLIEALLIFVAAIWIIKESIHKFIAPTPLEHAFLGVAIMLASSIVNIIVSNMLFKVARETDSIALSADAWHLRTDVYTSSGVMTGLAIIWLGGLIAPKINLMWVDPIAAIFVAFLIMKAARDLTVDSIKDLLDTKLSPKDEELISDHIKEISPLIRGFHDLRTRKAGSQRFVELHLMVDGKMSVEESHSLTDKIEAAIQEHFPVSTVSIHIEPCGAECKPDCVTGCLHRK